MTRLASLFLLFALLPTIGSADDRPNVVIMLADDLGWADVAYHGGPIDTPSLDRGGCRTPALLHDADLLADTRCADDRS